MCWIKIRSILNNLTDEEIRDFKNNSDLKDLRHGILIKMNGLV